MAFADSEVLALAAFNAAQAAVVSAEAALIADGGVDPGPLIAALAALTAAANALVALFASVGVAVSIPSPPLWGAPATLWGSGALWGSQVYWTQAGGSGLLWGTGVQNIPNTYPVPWQTPLVFEKMALQINAVASAQLGIGTFYARYQKTGYMTLGPGQH